MKRTTIYFTNTSGSRNVVRQKVIYLRVPNLQLMYLGNEKYLHYALTYVFPD